MISNISMKSMNISLKSFDISQNHLNLLYHLKISISAKIIIHKFTSAIFCAIAQINDQIKKRKVIKKIKKSTLISIKELLNAVKSQLLQIYKISNQLEILQTLNYIAHAIKNT